MKNVALGFLLLFPVLLAPAAGVVALAGAGDRASDGDIYLVVTWDRQHAQADLERLGAKLLGPVPAPFGFFVQVGEQQKQLARDNGHLMVAASALAKICGATASGRYS